ncbi:DUF6364 family protein [Gracilimonas mengyeensis]|uniref:Ribbon-helix-helix protein, copG family n=1 Tax=Gracilimonas mengyeensis TaxID=1302730 RepID=A0A521AGX5_9BACT|nr:DUF6364 family protein [Gracilimonas mengyeensis]SMO34075.1 hypothetical protein SAMN06265219_101132 [Gracilimonas mengyeensis]
MNKKLTLTIEEDIVEEAKKVASSKGRSLSSMVEDYLRVITKNETETKTSSGRVKKLKGILKVDSDFDYQKILKEEINKKHHG